MDPKSPRDSFDSTAPSRQRPSTMHDDDSSGANTAIMKVDSDSTVPVAPSVDTVPQDPDIFEELEEDSFSRTGTEQLLSNPKPVESELEPLKFSPKSSQPAR